MLIHYELNEFVKFYIFCYIQMSLFRSNNFNKFFLFIILYILFILNIHSIIIIIFIFIFLNNFNIEFYPRFLFCYSLIQFKLKLLTLILKHLHHCIQTFWNNIFLRSKSRKFLHPKNLIWFNHWINAFKLN